MKALINNKIILMWGIIILLIVNLSAMMTFYYKLKTAQRTQPSVPVVMNYKENQNMASMPFVKKLNFTPEQIETFYSLRKRHQQETASLQDELFNLRREIARELSSEKPQQKKLIILSDKFGRIQAEIKLKTFEHFVQIKAICDKEQKEIFNANMNLILDKQSPGEPGKRHRRQYRSQKRYNN